MISLTIQLLKDENNIDAFLKLTMIIHCITYQTKRIQSSIEIIDLIQPPAPYYSLKRYCRWPYSDLTMTLSSPYDLPLSKTIWIVSWVGNFITLETTLSACLVTEWHTSLLHLLIMDLATSTHNSPLTSHCRIKLIKFLCQHDVISTTWTE